MHEQQTTGSAPRLSAGVRASLACPVCKQRLDPDEEDLSCADAECGARFPVVRGVPVLINERASVFSIADFVAQRSTTFDLSGGEWRAAIRRCVPSISRNVKGERNNRRFLELLLSRGGASRVLVVGAGPEGAGLEFLSSHPGIEVVATDVSLGRGVDLICDAHDVPFADASFDAAIAHAVLEHVVDPHRCADELHRVLKTDGIIYADTPFMQQVHARQYDFERFTHLGHRRLFRRFEEIDSGASCGPGMALAWAYQYFLMSFADKWLPRQLLWAFSSYTSFFLKYFDALLIDKPGALDAASGYYFIGRKSADTLPDRELVKMYKGAI